MGSGHSVEGFGASFRLCNFLLHRELATRLKFLDTFKFRVHAVSVLLLLSAFKL